MIVELSDSQIKTYQRCARRWAYEKILKVDPNESKDNLVFGDAVHQGLETYIKSGDDLLAAKTAAITAINEGGHSAREWALLVAPAMVEGWAKFWVPRFRARYAYVALEEWFEVYPHPQVRLRGYMDARAESLTTKRLSLWDYKTTSDKTGGDLASNLSINNQLARYATSWRRLHNEWPEEVGLVFLKKPKKSDLAAACHDAQNNPENYFDRAMRVTPSFAAFALSVERSDVLYGLQMLHFKKLHAEHGAAALDAVPANFNNCEAYGSMCGFSKGCHVGSPLHTTFPAVKAAS